MLTFAFRSSATALLQTTAPELLYPTLGFVSTWHDREVVVGRPALEPAGLLPEQQLKERAGEVYQAKSRSVSFAVEDSEEDQCATQEDVYSFFKAE